MQIFNNDEWIIKFITVPTYVHPRAYTYVLPKCVRRKVRTFVPEVTATSKNEEKNKNKKVKTRCDTNQQPPANISIKWLRWKDHPFCCGPSYFLLFISYFIFILFHFRFQIPFFFRSSTESSGSEQAENDGKHKRHCLNLQAQSHGTLSSSWFVFLYIYFDSFETSTREIWLLLNLFLFVLLYFWFYWSSVTVSLVRGEHICEVCLRSGVLRFIWIQFVTLGKFLFLFLSFMHGICGSHLCAYPGWLFSFRQRLTSSLCVLFVLLTCYLSSMKLCPSWIIVFESADPILSCLCRSVTDRVFTLLLIFSSGILSVGLVYWLEYEWEAISGFACWFKSVSLFY